MESVSVIERERAREREERGERERERRERERESRRQAACVRALGWCGFKDEYDFVLVCFGIARVLYCIYRPFGHANKNCNISASTVS